MKTFEFRVTQTAEVFYEGELSIDAKSEQEAIELIKQMNQNEISDLCDNWEICLDDVCFNDPIEVWNDETDEVIN